MGAIAAMIASRISFKALGITAAIVGVALVLAAVALHLRADGRVKAERDRLRVEVAAWKDANAKAREWAEREKAAKEAAATQSKETADASLVQARRAGEAAADRYVERNRCVRVADQGRIERPDLPRSDSVAGQPARPAAEPLMVGIGDADFRACTAAVIDLANARAWAAEMVAKGLAR